MPGPGSTAAHGASGLDVRDASAGMYDLSRVAVFGASGAGKSTLARRLARLQAVPRIAVDRLRREVDGDVTRLLEVIDRATAESQWVFDGNRWLFDGPRRIPLDDVWQRTTTVIWLNYPIATIWWRRVSRAVEDLVRRRARVSDTRSFLPARLRSVVKIKFARARRRRYSELFARHEGSSPSVLEFRHPREAERFLRLVAAGHRRAADAGLSPVVANVLRQEVSSGRG